MSVSRGHLERVDGKTHVVVRDKVVLARRRRRRTQARPRLADPAEWMRRALAMLKLHEDRDIAATPGELAVWCNLTVRQVRNCLRDARMFRDEVRRRHQFVQDTIDVA